MKQPRHKPIDQKPKPPSIPDPEKPTHPPKEPPTKPNNDPPTKPPQEPPAEPPKPDKPETVPPELPSESGGNYLFLVILTFLFLSYISGIAQQPLVSELPENEQEAIEAIALYPEKEREAILIASQHPEVLVRLQNIRNRSENDFYNIIASMPENDQKKVYDLVRYPDLVEEICDLEPSENDRVLEELIADYPDDTRANARYVHHNYLSQLRLIRDLYNRSEREFEEVLAPYPSEVETAYASLVNLPEVITTLSENMETTVLLGDIYSRNKSQLMRELDSLNVVVAEEKAKELNDWKEELENNPEAMREFEQASQEFAEEEGYETDEIRTEPTRTVTEVYVHHVWQPYPYWFGWPYWYTYEHWYPYPWWYHWGYYYGPRNVIVFVGLPSPYFMHWHFGYHHHFYHYPHYTNTVVNYYYGHRESTTSIHTAVRTWERQHRDELPRDWLKSDEGRVSRIQEYGRFKMDYESAASKAQGRVVTEREFLEKNAGKYPGLKPVLEQKRPEERPERKPDVIRKPSEIEYKPRPKKVQPDRPKREEIERARSYHENVWRKSKPQPKVIEPRRQTTPPPRKTVPRKTVPRKKTPQSRKSGRK